MSLQYLVRHKPRGKYQKHTVSGYEKLLYVLKTNKKCTKGELIAFSGLNNSSILQNITMLRRGGYKILLIGEFYCFEGFE